MSPMAAVLFAVAGAILGIAADRLAARWPAHPDGAVRRVDWRTFAVSLAGGLVFLGLALRWADPRDVLVLGLYFAALLVLLATDLDQKLLPDVVTLPLIAGAAVIVLIGWDPLLATKSLGVASAVIAGLAVPAALVLGSMAFRGDLGMGDVKLAVSLGLMSGIILLVSGLLVASIAASAVLIVLIGARRIGLRSAIPFGPILIAAGIVAALLPAA